MPLTCSGWLRSSSPLWVWSKCLLSFGTGPCLRNQVMEGRWFAMPLRGTFTTAKTSGTWIVPQESGSYCSSMEDCVLDRVSDACVFTEATILTFGCSFTFGTFTSHGLITLKQSFKLPYILIHYFCNFLNAFRDFFYSQTQTFSLER